MSSSEPAHSLLRLYPSIQEDSEGFTMVLDPALVKYDQKDKNVPTIVASGEGVRGQYTPLKGLPIRDPKKASITLRSLFDDDEADRCDELARAWKEGYSKLIGTIQENIASNPVLDAESPFSSIDNWAGALRRGIGHALRVQQDELYNTVLTTSKCLSNDLTEVSHRRPVLSSVHSELESFELERDLIVSAVFDNKNRATEALSGASSISRWVMHILQAENTDDSKVRIIATCQKTIRTAEGFRNVHRGQPRACGLVEAITDMRKVWLSILRIRSDAQLPRHERTIPRHVLKHFKALKPAAVVIAALEDWKTMESHADAARSAGMGTSCVETSSTNREAPPESLLPAEAPSFATQDTKVETFGGGSPTGNDVVDRVVASAARLQQLVDEYIQEKKIGSGGSA